MEEDREASNIGPSSPSDLATSQNTKSSKEPRRRFVGRKTTAAPGSKDEDTLAIQTKRAPRFINQIPPEILHDEELNAAIAHLPSNYNFEIHKTIHRIRTLEAKNIALQMPEGLLMYAPLISDIITQFCPGADTLINGDVTYGACCIDDYTARALGCDLLIHYGHSCLIPVDQTQGIKTLYVFVTIGIDTEHLVATIERNFQYGKRIGLVGTIQFNASINAIVPKLRAMGYDPFLPRSAPLSAGEILGCTAPSLTSSPKVSVPAETKPGSRTDADMILYVGDGRFHLESIMIASPELRNNTYRYDPYSRRLTSETYEHEEMHSLRQSAIDTARQTLRSSPKSSPQTWGIILGTLGRQGNPHTLGLIETQLRKRRIHYVTLLLSEIQPAKLALMSQDVGVWVQIACPRLSIDWGYAFERPLLSPYEALVALDVKESTAWAPETQAQMSQGSNSAKSTRIGVYPMDFYSKEGLGRTRKEDVPEWPLEIEVK